LTFGKDSEPVHAVNTLASIRFLFNRHMSILAFERGLWVDTGPLLNRAQFASAVMRATQHLVVNFSMVNITNDELIAISDNHSVNDSSVTASFVSAPAR
jgi:hypothetical protein